MWSVAGRGANVVDTSEKTGERQLHKRVWVRKDRLQGRQWQTHGESGTQHQQQQQQHHNHHQQQQQFRLRYSPPLPAAELDQFKADAESASSPDELLAAIEIYGHGLNKVGRIEENVM